MTDQQQDIHSTKVDLTSCEQEPIHIPGRVQSYGALLSVSSDWIINHASKNIDSFLGLEAASLIGCSITECLNEDAIHDIRTKLQMLGANDSVERQFAVQLTDEPDLFDIAIHLSGRSIIIEMERHEDQSQKDYIGYVRPMIERIGKAETVEQLCETAARQLRALIGYDRVMVYKFGQDDSGEVLAEAKLPAMESFKGLRYPASDIPKQARALYKRNLLRIIGDVKDIGAEIQPVLNPEGEPLDLSLSTTRAVSPIHLEYLSNMGVNASLSISILKRGELWGLFACHHNKPRVISYEMRSAAELFGQLFSFVLDQKESDQQREEQVRGQILHDQLMAQLAEGSSLVDNFETIVSSIESVIPYDGAIGWIDGQFMSMGETPTQEEFSALARFLNTTAASTVFKTNSIKFIYSAASDFSVRAAGMLALPVSRTPRDYIVFFRKEIAQSVQWAGDPEKPAELGPNGIRLTPRKSFSAWQEIVRDSSQPWSSTQVRAAEALRITLLEVVLRMSDASNKDRAKAQEHQELLIAELNHRVRNILNLIRSLVSQSKKEGQSVSDFTTVIGGRIHALARAHDQITEENWSPASAHELIRTEAEAYFGEKANRIIVEGPDPFLEPTAFTTLSLVIHELMTNSAKYGALCDSKGTLTILFKENDDGSININWNEAGGPAIQSPPTRRGFGSTIIEKSIPFELKGKANMRFEISGLKADFMIPSSHVSNLGENMDGNVNKSQEIEKLSTTGLTGNVLLVEDNMIIAMDTEDMLQKLGAETVHLAASIAEALEFIDTQTISFAVLDVNLGNETSEPIAKALHTSQIPFVFATGYGDAIALIDEFPNVQVLQKPFGMANIQNTLSVINESR